MYHVSSTAQQALTGAEIYSIEAHKQPCGPASRLIEKRCPGSFANPGPSIHLILQSFKVQMLM